MSTNRWQPETTKYLNLYYIGNYLSNWQLINDSQYMIPGNNMLQIYFKMATIKSTGN